MKSLEVFGIDLTEFIAGKQIDNIAMHDNSLVNHQSLLFVVYWPVINKLTIIKAMASSEEILKSCLLLENEYAIFYSI
jgi:hypothetical protein